MKRPITRKRVTQVWMSLQSITFSPGMSAQNRGRIRTAMDLLDEVRTQLRRMEIFAAGARAKKPVPRLEGKRLGSFESMTFYDGYASTHPGFKNPYRQGP